MILWMGLPLFLMGLGLYLVFRWSAQGGSLQVSSNRALDILAERYARGEIDADQYRRMKEELAQSTK